MYTRSHAKIYFFYIYVHDGRYRACVPESFTTLFLPESGNEPKRGFTAAECSSGIIFAGAISRESRAAHSQPHTRKAKMGAYLSEPITEKVSSDQLGKDIAYGASSMQGWRLSQEV